MDPNALLERIMANRTTLLLHDDDETARELAEDIGALDEWLTAGGFLPTPWARRRTGRLYVARGVKVILDSNVPDIGAEEFEVDVLVNHWPDGTSTTALQQSRGGHWYVPGALVEESSG